MFDIELAIQHAPFAIDQQRLEQAVSSVLRTAEIDRATISIAVVDDTTIQRVHDEFMSIDEPTDVLSFVLESDEGYVDGEIVASADTAERTAERLGWNAAEELLLYVVHGALHLVGYDDLNPEAKKEMRRREREVLAEFGIAARYDDA